MEYPYPSMTNYLLIKRRNARKYEVKNCMTSMTYLMDAEDFFFLKFLNGSRDPYDYRKLTRKEITKNLHKFSHCDLIRMNTEVMPGMHTFFIPKNKRAKNSIPMLANVLLLLFFLPVFFYGTYTLRRHLPAINTNSSFCYIVGGVLGFVLGSFMHELGHVIACLAYKGSFFEMGVLSNFLPGVYALIDSSNVNRRLKRVQILAAGIEMNLLVAGIGFILSAKVRVMGGLFFWMAAPSVLFAVINLSTMKSLDGNSIMEELTGINGNTFFELLNGKGNMQARRNKASGYAVILSAVSVSISTLLIPLFLIVEFVSILF